MDRIMKVAGWTHRLKRKSRDPYVKLRDGQTMFEGKEDAEFIDTDQKFRTIRFEDLVEL